MWNVTDTRHLYLNVAEHPSNWGEPLLSIERTGDRVTMISMDLSAFDIEIKDGRLYAKPRDGVR